MTDLRASEKKYAAAMQKVFTDEKVKKDLERDPAGTLEKLGFTLSPAARAEIAGAGGAKAELAFGAFPAVLVRVVTSGTQPAVRVITASSTIAATREPVKESKSPAKPQTPKR